MTRMDHSKPYKRPGSGGATQYPPSGGEDWYPLTNVTWIPETEEVEIETCEHVRTRVPYSGLRGWLRQQFRLDPKYVDEVVCHVEKQQQVVRIRKQYDK